MRLTFVSPRVEGPFPSRPPPSEGRTGMTLIEILIVIAVLAILVSMLSTMLSIAQRQGRSAKTRATLMKVDQAIRLFRTDMRVYPWQVDLGAPPAEPPTWGNNLAWRLAWNPPTAAAATASDPDRVTYMRDVQADLSEIQQRFRFVNGRNVPPSGDSSEGTHAFRLEPPTTTSRTNVMVAAGSIASSLTHLKNYAERYIPGTGTLAYTNDWVGDAHSLTQMASEVTTLCYLAGQMPVLAPTGIDPALAEDKARFPQEDERHPAMAVSRATTLTFRYFPYNKAGHLGDDSRGPVLTTATARAKGWRADYLAGALSRTGATQQRDVDASGEAIVDAWGTPLVYICAVRPGVKGHQHGVSQTIFNGARAERYHMTTQGREATAVLDSDVRTTAAPPYTAEFELWSAGRDRRFAAERSDPLNADNVSLLPYTRGLE